MLKIACCASTEPFTSDKARDAIATLFVLTILQLALAAVVATNIPHHAPASVLRYFGLIVAAAMAVNGAATLACLFTIFRGRLPFGKAKAKTIPHSAEGPQKPALREGARD